MDWVTHVFVINIMQLWKWDKFQLLQCQPISKIYEGLVHYLSIPHIYYVYLKLCKIYFNVFNNLFNMFILNCIHSLIYNILFLSYLICHCKIMCPLHFFWRAQNIHPCELYLCHNIKCNKMYKPTFGPKSHCRGGALLLVR